MVRVVVPPLDGRFDARSHQVTAEHDDRFVARSMRRLRARSNVIVPSDMAPWGKTIEAPMPLFGFEKATVCVVD